ncbi:MAG: hypothetical protein IPJ65_31060 [Archangiaceae bacterium]|nr:hypothetical protein [Archangiaceae bacterium]
MPAFPTPVDDLVAAFSKMGVSSPDDLSALLTNPGKAPPIERVGIWQAANDAPFLLEQFEPMTSDPTNTFAVEAAARALMAMRRFDDAAALLDRLFDARGRVTDQDGRARFINIIMPMLCEARFEAGRSNADKACSGASFKSPISTGYRFRGRLSLAKGKLDAARDDFQTALTKNMRSGENWYWLGVTAALAGDPEKARSCWKEATVAWPDFTPALRALERPKTDLAQANADVDTYGRRVAARRLGRCARIHATLGLAERAERCFAAANAADSGAGDAYRFVQLAATRPEEALAVKPPARDGDPVLLAAMAELRLEKAREVALQLLTRAHGIDPGAHEVNLALVHACEGSRKGICREDHLARLLSPSEQREVNHGKVAQQVSSRFIGYVAPRLTRFELQPLLEGPAPELDGLAAVLEKRFPGAKFTVSSARSVPDGAIDEERQQVVSDYLFPKVARTKGLILIVDRDMGSLGMGFLYGNLELETVRGVVSISRFRSEYGAPTEPGEATDVSVRRSRERLQNQVTSTIAKLLGMSFPCETGPCVLQFPRDMSEFDAKGGAFCANHQHELEELLH